MSSPTQSLQELGFSQYEAQAYVALLRRNPLNGYELAKASGVPRANIYRVLARLDERGAVARLDAEDGTSYVPIRPEELFHGLRARLQTSLDDAQQSLCNLQAEGNPPQVWNLTGARAILAQAEALMEAAQVELLAAVSPQDAGALTTGLEAAQARGVAITTLCLAGCPQECGACRGDVHRYHVASGAEERSVLLVRDRCEVLAGELGEEGIAQAIRTRQQLLVDLAARRIQEGIALGAIVLDLGPQLDSLLQPETRRVLSAVGPPGSGRGWLGHMRELLAESGQAEADR